MRIWRYTPRVLRAVAAVLGLPFAYAGCAALQSWRASAPRYVTMRTAFDYSEHEPYAQPGENSIVGQGVLTRPGGGVVTCAGSRVLLLPGTAYFREMIQHLVAGSEPDPPETPYPGLKDMIKKTQCDAQGNFSFTEIPDGPWFVLTQVNGRRGVVLIREMNPSNRGTIKVLFTDNDIVAR